MTKRGVYAFSRHFSPKRNARLLAGSLTLDRQAGRLCAMKRAISNGRGRNRFSFRRRSPCLPLPTPCVRLHPPACPAIHSFLRCDRLSESAYRCIWFYRLGASHSPAHELSQPVNSSIPRLGEGRIELGRCGPRVCDRLDKKRDYCLVIQSSTSLRA